MTDVHEAPKPSQRMRAAPSSPANPGAEQLFGYRQDELVGLPLERIDAEPSFLEDNPATSLDQRAGAEREWEYRRRDGTVVPVNEATTRLRDEAGVTTGHICVAYDMPRRRCCTWPTTTRSPTCRTDHCWSPAFAAIAEAADAGTGLAVLLLDLDQIAYLRDRGCDGAQGYYFSSDVPAGSIPSTVLAVELFARR